MTDLTSTVDASQTHVGLTFFPCKLCTLPSEETVGLSFDQAAERIAPAAGPRVVEDKDRIEFYLPCALQDAPLKGKTATRFPPGHVGKMRSATHVTAGALLSPEFDQATEADVDATLAALRAAHVRFVAFNTWSFGLKPGHRTRFLMALDRPLGPAEYGRAYDAVNQVFFGGKADPANRQLHQQAGTWGVASDRAGIAFRHQGGSRLLSAEALLAQSPATPKGPHAPSRLIPVGITRPEAERQRVLDAMFTAQPPNEYGEWLVAAAGLRAAVELGMIEEELGRELWLWHSARAGETAQAANDDARYDPERLWEIPFDAPAQARIGRFFTLVAEQALARIQHAVVTGALSEDGACARAYLHHYHSARLRASLMTGVAQ